MSKLLENESKIEYPGNNALLRKEIGKIVKDKVIQENLKKAEKFIEGHVHRKVSDLAE